MVSRLAGVVAALVLIPVPIILLPCLQFPVLCIPALRFPDIRIGVVPAVIVLIQRL